MKMLGPMCHEGPGGRDCACCNEAPGRGRRAKRRYVKRAERQKVRKEILSQLA